MNVALLKWLKREIRLEGSGACRHSPFTHPQHPFLVIQPDEARHWIRDSDVLERICRNGCLLSAYHSHNKTLTLTVPRIMQFKASGDEYNHTDTKDIEQHSIVNDTYHLNRGSITRIMRIAKPIESTTVELSERIRW